MGWQSFLQKTKKNTSFMQDIQVPHKTQRAARVM